MLTTIHDQSLIKTQSFIDGSWQGCEQQFDVIDPATEQLLTRVDNADAALAENAVIAAKQALKEWSALTAYERGQLILKWHQLIADNTNDLAQLLTLEQGKPLAEAVAEINYGNSYLEWFAEEGKRVYGDTIPAAKSNNRIIIIKQPVGVVTAITPWNFPNAMMARKAAAALAAGCTFVCKPASETPLSALAMAELAHRAGIPDGVFNVVVGTDASGIGKVFTQHPAVAKFSFTGSTAVGKILSKQCADSVKKVSMELGGNAPFIIFDDADLDEAVKGLMLAKFRNAGQTCVCANRVLIDKKISQRFLQKFQTAIDNLVVGNGLDPSSTLGPLISNKAKEQLDKLLIDAEQQGAEISSNTLSNQAGYFMSPAIVKNISNDMAIAQTELFGPVVPIIEFETEQQAIELANNTEYGLASYFYSRDIGRVWRIGEQLEFGMVGINEGIISNAAAPFGGSKQSGNGREGSKYGLDDYLETKYMCLGGI